MYLHFLTAALLPLIVSISAAPPSPVTPEDATSTSLSAAVPTTSISPDGIPCPGIDCFIYLVGTISPWNADYKADSLWDPR